MEKKALQEQFEAIAIQNCWNINKYPAGWDDRGDDEYADEFVNGAWWAFQHQQVKVEGLQKRVDSLEKTEFVLARIRSIASKRLLESILIKEVRQALRGEG